MTVFEAARQVDCIQAAERLGLQLKRSGSRRFTRCLFYAENTPSMCLYPDDGGFYCFGCQEHGDVIRLYQQALSISHLDAAKRICSDFGLSYDQRKHKKQAPPPYKPPTLNVQTLTKKLTDWREEQVQRLLCTERTADAQMEQIESRCIKAGMVISDALEEPEWEAAFQQKCIAQERIVLLDSLSLPELLLQMKEEIHEKNELDMLSQLLEEDDFAKGIAIGLSSERVATLGRLRAMQPWQNERYSNSDIGNGFLFADFYKDTARFVSECKYWFIYDGSVWRADVGNLKAMEKCKELATLLFLLTAEIKDTALRDVCVKRASRWHNRGVRETILKDAASVYCLRMEDFDRDHYLFNCLNGTLNLRTGEFREHRPEDFLTMMSGVNYDKEARCPRWVRFMTEIMQSPTDIDSEQKARYLQKAFGYALTGNTRFECLFILYGATTRNGKGTAMETFLRLMGDYGKTARPETQKPSARAFSRTAMRPVRTWRGLMAQGL